MKGKILILFAASWLFLTACSDPQQQPAPTQPAGTQPSPQVPSTTQKSGAVVLASSQNWKVLIDCQLKNSQLQQTAYIQYIGNQPSVETVTLAISDGTGESKSVMSPNEINNSFFKQAFTTSFSVNGWEQAKKELQNIKITVSWVANGKSNEETLQPTIYFPE